MGDAGDDGKGELAGDDEKDEGEAAEYSPGPLGERELRGTPVDIIFSL